MRHDTIQEKPSCMRPWYRAQVKSIIRNIGNSPWFMADSLESAMLLTFISKTIKNIKSSYSTTLIMDLKMIMTLTQTPTQILQAIRRVSCAQSWISPDVREIFG